MSARFEIRETSIEGLKIVQRKPVGDHRGYLERLFCAEEFESLIHGKSIVQINRSLTSKCGVVRGMHFQNPPHAEIKAVTCLRGEVFDVAVDLRRGSPTFLAWHAETLSAGNHKTILIPEGFAHGFQTLTADCELLYFHTATWRADAEAGVNPQDPRINVRWPKPVTEMSARDAAQPLLTAAFEGVRV